MTEIKDIKTALEIFENACLKHSEATEKGDYKTGNKNYSLIVKAISFLQELNGMENLTKFLSHNSLGVRMWSATYLLPVSEKESLQVLNQIASETGILAFIAKTTVCEWEKGNLKL